jgi:type I site-specific restriction endonuclease
MPETPEQKARREIDADLTAAGWIVQDREDLDLTAGRGIAVREFSMKSGFGFADYLFYLDRKAVGAVEAKPEGTLTGVEAQSAKYAAGLEQGATIVAGDTGVYVDKRHKLTRRERLEFLNQDLTYTSNQLDRDIVSES